jgi:putative phage-type endonuclease
MGHWLNCETEEAWLEARRHHLTSTAMAAVAGVSKYETPLHVYRRHFNQLPVEENNYMRWGRLLQGVIAAEYERQTNTQLVHALPFDLMQHDTEPWAASSFDCFLGDDTVVEIKTGSEMSGNWGLSGTDEVPSEYIIQASWQLAISGRAKCEIAAFLRDTCDLRIYPIQRDEGIINHLLSIGASFWKNHIEAQVAPPPDFKHPETAELLKEMYGVQDLVVDLTMDADVLMDDYFRLRDKQEDLEKEVTEKKNELMAMIGEAAVATVPSGRNIRRKKVKRGAYMVHETEWIGDNLGALLKSYRKKKGSPGYVESE